MQSNLPPSDEVNAYIEIRHLKASQFKIPSTELAVEWQMSGRKSTQWEGLVPTEMFHITDPVLGYYIPSKVIANNGEFTLIYYVNPSLPDNVRPFADGQCYMWIAQLTPAIDLRYPADTRVFIDQVIDRSISNLYTVFITSSGEFDKLVVDNKRKVELEGELAVYAEGGSTDGVL